MESSSSFQSSDDEDDEDDVEEDEDDDDREESADERGDGATKEFAKVGELTDSLFELFTNPARTRPGSNEDHMRHVGQLVVLGQSSDARKRIEKWVAKDVRFPFLAGN
jgi:hypothetical protein